MAAQGANLARDSAPLDTPLRIEEFDSNSNAPVGIAWLMFRIVRREADAVLKIRLPPSR
jgi:hypothetical protein